MMVNGAVMWHPICFINLGGIVRPRQRSPPQTSDLGAREASCTISTDDLVGPKSVIFKVDFDQLWFLRSLQICAQWKEQGPIEGMPLTACQNSYFPRSYRTLKFAKIGRK